MSKLFVLYSFLLVGLVSADFGRYDGRLFTCPKVTVPSEFNLNQYLGLWYEYAKYPFIWSIGSKCVTAEYGQDSNGNVTVLNKQIGRILGLETSAYGVAKVIAPGKLSVSFPMTSGRQSPYWVLGTDYTHYAVVFSCTEGFPTIGRPNVWILTRDRQPSEQTIAKAYAVLDENSLSLRRLINTDQTGCLN